MKYLAIVQARCGSTRFPNKVLKLLNGKEMVLQVIERVQRSKYVDEVVLATSIERDNLPLITTVSSTGIRVFAGSEEDVLDRFYQVAKLLKPEYIVRITADCPLYDANILDNAIEQMTPDDDYIGDINEVLADGLDIEVFKFSALEKAYQNANLMSEREHVTIYIKNHKEIFSIKSIEATISGISGLRLTVDEKEDFDLVQTIYSHFKDNEEFYTPQIVSLLEQNPYLKTLNDKFERNEGLKKSLLNDAKI